MESTGETNLGHLVSDRPADPPSTVVPGADASEPDRQDGEEIEEEEPPEEHDVDNDYDSAYGESLQASDLGSITSEISKHRYENGRRYHAYRDGAYWAPNDDVHNDQQDMAHHLWLLTFDDKLFLAPLPNPQVS